MDYPWLSMAIHGLSMVFDFSMDVGLAKFLGRPRKQGEEGACLVKAHLKGRKLEALKPEEARELPTRHERACVDVVHVRVELDRRTHPCGLHGGEICN